LWTGKKVVLQQNRDRSLTVSAFLFAAISGALFLVLGNRVAHHPPSAADLWLSLRLHDRSDLIAWIFTWSCYVYVLGPLCIALVVVALRYPQWRNRVVFSLTLLVVTWAASDAFQRVFMRPRRIDWLVKHETAFSYPSTHGDISLVVYGFWAVLLLASDLPKSSKIAAAAVLFCIMLGTWWARLSLGAHYPSDILGGVLLALSLIFAGFGVCSLTGIPLAGRGATRWD